MLRIGAIFIAVCMVLIAASLGAVLYLGLKVDARSSVIVALTALTAMAIYSSVSSRLRDRDDIGDQIADLSHGTADLARQVGELSRRLTALESRVGTDLKSTRAAADPLAVEMEELGSLVRRIAEAVAVHETVLQKQGALTAARVANEEAVAPAPIDSTPARHIGNGAAEMRRFNGLSREGIVTLIGPAPRPIRAEALQSVSPEVETASQLAGHSTAMLVAGASPG